MENLSAKELRIGNLVNCLGKDYEVSALGIRNDVIGLKGRPLTAMNLVNEIVLTEDWLLKLQVPMEFCVSKGYFFWFNGNKIYIKYVHQLQNLYFALTGKELEINE